MTDAEGHAAEEAPNPGPSTAPGVPGPALKQPLKAQVKPFTKESLERYENKTVQLVREYGFQPRRKLSVEDGSLLPVKYEPFPKKLYGRPLEEIDNFIYEEVCHLQNNLNARYKMSILWIASKYVRKNHEKFPFSNMEKHVAF